MVQATDTDRELDDLNRRLNAAKRQRDQAIESKNKPVANFLLRRIADLTRERKDIKDRRT